MNFHIEGLIHLNLSFKHQPDNLNYLPGLGLKGHLGLQ